MLTPIFLGLALVGLGWFWRAHRKQFGGKNPESFTYPPCDRRKVTDSEMLRHLGKQGHL